MTKTNDPPLVASVALIPDSDEKADLDAPSDESGKLVVGQVPNISISETIVVADQAERLSLEVQEGDVAIQSDTTESYIFTGGPNVEVNWQLVQFDAVGGISGEDIAPRDIDGRNVTLNDLSVNGLLNGADTSGAAAGEALTSDGSGSFQFASVGGIEEVATFGDLPAIDPPQIAYVIDQDEYYHSNLTAESYDILSLSLSSSIDSQAGLPVGIAFDNNGSQLYVVDGDNSNINQFDLSTVFEINTASLSTSINTQDSSPTDIALNADGSKLFEVGENQDLIYELDLSTPFDITTASLSKTIAAQDSRPQGIAFNNKGTKLYEIGRGSNQIYQSNLSNPFDINSSSFSVSIDSEDGAPVGIAWNNDGSRLYELGIGEAKVYDYVLSEPFDIRSASIDRFRETIGPFPFGIAWDDEGSRFYETDNGSKDVLQSDIGSLLGWREF